MRAGLLSDAQVIATINEKFISSWIIIDDIKRRLGGAQDALANTLLYLHQYPFDFMFLDSDGKYVTRLTSFQDLPAAHSAVSHPRRDGHESHTAIFLETVQKHFGTD